MAPDKAAAIVGAIEWLIEAKIERNGTMPEGWASEIVESERKARTELTKQIESLNGKWLGLSAD